MRIGYPVINLALGITPSSTFRLATFTPERMVKTARRNLDATKQMIRWNIMHGLLFTRIGSGIVPFASHNVSTGVDWQSELEPLLSEIGKLVRQAGMRISMHPGHFVVINSPSEAVFANTVAELEYQAAILDGMGLDGTHKVQVHLGGIHGDLEGSIDVFQQRYQQLPEAVRWRLVIENDERSASLKDCLALHEATGIPIIFDTLHHSLKNHGEPQLKALDAAMATWGESDGIPMVDYSTQDPAKKPGAHAVTLNTDDFRKFIKRIKSREIDIMFEIKNKEASALQAKAVLEVLASEG